MIPGETVHSGASDVCECGKVMPMRVCRSNNYYIGTWCCYPNTRESVEYYATEEEAELALKNNTWTIR